MLYHFNDVDNRENDILSTSYRHVELTPIRCYDRKRAYSHDPKKFFDLSFSERFESIKENKKSIREIVFPKKSTIIFFIYIIIFISYLYVGALCFKTIELDREISDRHQFFEFRSTFLKNHSCVTDNRLEELIFEVQKLSGRGVSPLGNATAESYNWDLFNAVFFATSLVTTIGYGNDKPMTNLGKVFCIFYVILGIPMMMILTSAVVERLFLLVDLCFSALFYKIQWKITEDKFRELQIIFNFLVLTVCFFLIPSLAFYKMEHPKWSFLDSLYFCVISLTTIGLGDLVPGDVADHSKRNTSRVLATVYLFTGLLATSFFIRSFHRHPKWNLGDRFIYLYNETSQVHEYTISDSSTLSDTSQRGSSEQLESYPIDLNTINANRGKRIRYNSFS